MRDSWTNIGDINPKHGALMIMDPQIATNGDFTIQMIETIPETTVGGGDHRFLIREGTAYLAQKNFSSALDVIGAKIDKDQAILTPNAQGGFDRYEKGSDDWVITMASAAHAYGGIDDINIESLVQIGEDDAHSQPRKFTGEITKFAEGSGLWAIMTHELDGFDNGHGQPRPTVIEGDEDLPEP